MNTNQARALQTRDTATPPPATPERELIEQIGRGVTDMRSRADAAAAKNESDLGEVRASLKAQGEALAAIEAQRQADARARIIRAENADADAAAREQVGAFLHYVRNGNLDKLQELATRMRAAGLEARATVGVNDVQPLGGFLVIPELDRQVERTQAVFTDIRSFADVRQIGTTRYVKPVKKSGTTARRLAAQMDARTPSNVPEWAEIAIDVHDAYADVAFTNNILADAFLNLDAEIVADFAEAFGVLEAAESVNGTGVSQWRGFMNPEQGFAAQTSATEVAYGKIGYVATGQAATLATSPANGDGADPFVKVTTRLKPQFLPNAAFYHNRNVLADIMLLKDADGRPLWQPALSAGTPSTLRGFPDRIIEGMDNLGANKFPVAFGDMRATFLIVDRAGMNVLRNPYKTTGQTIFEVTKRNGAGHKRFDALKVIKCAAS